MPDREPTLHLIGHAHIDPVWLWRWPDGAQEVKSTFRSVLDRMEEDESFVYTSSAVAFYAWLRRNEPAMFEEFRRRVAEGRWYLAGGWWVEPDCNLACGESYVRQPLIGQRWLHEHVGVIATVGFNPDSFGHHGMLPQLLTKSGLDAYVFMRPADHERALPSRTFWWESADGSRVLAFRIPYEYGSWGKELDEHVDRCAAELRPPETEMMCFYGVGNHGGGPTQENLASIRRLQQEGRADRPRLEMSDPGRFFAAVRASGVEPPVVHGELQHHARGCYAAHSGIKRWNRRAEQRLLDAERLSVVAARHVVHEPQEDLSRAWKNVLFNQDHNILPGASIEPAYADARDELGESAAIATRAVYDALQAISWRIDVPHEDGTIPIFVWNPNSWASTVPVELEVGNPPPSPVLVDADGDVHPVQRIASHATVSGGRARITFLAELPPLGYQMFRVQAGSDPAASDLVPASDTSLDNGLVRLDFDPDRGSVRLHDHRTGLTLTDEGLAFAEVIRDPSDTWSHGVLRFDAVVGTFEVDRVRLVEQGAVRSVVRVEASYGASRLIQDVAVYRGLPYVDVRVRLDWRERFKACKLRFPVQLRYPRATYEIPFGAIERRIDGEEQPGQGWVDLSGARTATGRVVGLSLITEAKQSFDVLDNTIGLTIVRSPIHAHHDPKEPSDDELYSFQDQGLQDFRYRLLPHAGGWVEGGTVRVASEFRQPATTHVETSHRGPLPWKDSFLAIDVSNVAMSAFKRAEDGGAAILRCYETHGAAVHATITLPPWERTIETDFGAHEIRTFRIPDDPAEPVTDVDLLEWEVGRRGSATGAG
jgi:alpha-mannosidase